MQTAQTTGTLTIFPPLLGKTISGLHHPDNLQYLPAWVNCMKGNRWDDSWASHTMDTPSLEEKIKAYSKEK